MRLPSRRAIFLLVAAALILTACGGASDDMTLSQITLYMGFRPDVQFTPFYVGIEKGIFNDHGLDLTLTHESQESTMARLVATGEAPFAVVSGEQVLLGRGEELPIVYIYEWFQEYPVAVVSKEALDIERPADLQGHSVGVPLLSGASYTGLEALLFEAGLTDEDIQLEATGFTQVETLITDRVDAVVVYRTNEPVQLAAQDVAINTINVADYVDLVSNGLITSEAVIEENPELAREMVAAFDEALQYTIDHPEEAFEISKGFVEGLDDPAVEDTQKAVLGRSIVLWRADRPGYSEVASWRAMQDVLQGMGLLNDTLDLEAAYTNEFLPQP